MRTRTKIGLMLIMIALVGGAYLLYANYGASIVKLDHTGDYDERAKGWNKLRALPTPWKFKYERKELYKGLDLSHHNKITSFDALADYDFVYHKATEGSTFKDPKFEERMCKFVEMGIPCGAYHFFSTGSSGKAQFENFKNCVPKDFPLIPVLDIEINKNRWSKSKLNKELATWIKLCEKHYGIKPIIYSSSDFYIFYNLGQHDCMFWSGDVNATPRINPCMHQKRLVKVKGLAGAVDYNEAPDVMFNPSSSFVEK